MDPISITALVSALTQQALALSNVLSSLVHIDERAKVLHYRAINFVQICENLRSILDDSVLSDVVSNNPGPFTTIENTFKAARETMTKLDEVLAPLLDKQQTGIKKGLRNISLFFKQDKIKMLSSEMDSHVVYLGFSATTIQVATGKSNHAMLERVIIALDDRLLKTERTEKPREVDVIPENIKIDMRAVDLVRAGTIILSKASAEPSKVGEQNQERSSRVAGDDKPVFQFLKNRPELGEVREFTTGSRYNFPDDKSQVPIAYTAGLWRQGAAPERRLACTNKILETIISDDGMFVALMTMQKRHFHKDQPWVEVFDSDNGRQVDKFERLFDQRSQMAFRPPRNHTLAVADSSGSDQHGSLTMRHFGRAHESQPFFTGFIKFVGDIRKITYSRDGSLLGCQLENEEVRVWDADTIMLLQVWLPEERPLQLIRLSPDNQFVTFYSSDGDDSKCPSTLTNRNIVSSEMSKTPNVRGNLSYLAISHDCTQYAASNNDTGNIQMYNIENGEFKSFRNFTPNNIGEAVKFAAFSTDSSWLVTVSAFGIVKIWNVASGKLLLNTNLICRNDLVGFKLSPNDDRLAIYDNNGLILLYAIKRVGCGIKIRMLQAMTSPLFFR